MDTGKLPVYCHMTAAGIGRACGGGGWTLVMKIDGRKVFKCLFSQRSSVVVLAICLYTRCGRLKEHFGCLFVYS